MTSKKECGEEEVGFFCVSLFFIERADFQWGIGTDKENRSDGEERERDKPDNGDAGTFLTVERNNLKDWRWRFPLDLFLATLGRGYNLCDADDMKILS